MEKTKVKVKLSIEGETLDPKAVSNELDMITFESWGKGEALKNKRKRPCGSWSILVGFEESYDITIQLYKLFELIKGKEEEIKNIKNFYEGNVIISVIIEVENGDVPGITIDEETTAILIKIGAEIDIDIYLMS